MADWPGHGWGSAAPQIGSPVAADGLPSPSLAAGAAAHVKNTSWTELIALVEHPATALLLQFGNEGLGSNRNWFIDIAFGSAGSEVLAIPNLWVSHGVLGEQGWHYLLPIDILKGTRISARASCNASSPIRCAAQVFSGHWLSQANPSPVVMYGGNTANTGGTALTPGATTMSSWVEVTAATSFAHTALIISCGKLFSDSALTTNFFAMDIGIGASGQEQVLFGAFPVVAHASTDSPSPQIVGPVPLVVPKGSRLAIRGQGDAAQTGQEFVIYGMG